MLLIKFFINILSILSILKNFIFYLSRNILILGT